MCRAYLSPFWDENGKERYIGRANLGAVSLALPRYAIMSEGNKDKFFEILDKYFDYAMEVHNLTYEKMRKVKAKTNPLMFCEGGGLYKLDPEDTIEKALEYMTYSIGYIGLTEVCYYMTGKHLHEDNSFAIEVLKHLNKRIEEEKAEIEALREKASKKMSLFKILGFVTLILAVGLIFLILFFKTRKQIEEYDQRLAQLDEEYKNIRTDYAINKIGVAYVPVATRVPFEGKSFLVDHTKKVNETNFQLTVLHNPENF